MRDTWLSKDITAVHPTESPGTGVSFTVIISR